MKLWYLNHYAGGPGIGKFMRAFHLAKAWAEEGHETTVFVAAYHHQLETPEPLPSDKRVDGVRYVGLRARRYSGNGIGRVLNMADYCVSAFRLRARSDLAAPDVVIVSSPHPFAIFPGWWLARRYKAKLVFEIRDLWPLSVVEINGTSPWHPFVLLCGVTERFAYRVSDLVGTLLAGAREHVKQVVRKPPPCVYVPNGANPGAGEAKAPSSASGVAARAQLETWRKEGRLILIHPGAQGIPNALDRLLNAVSVLNGDGNAGKIGVLLVGEGGATEALKRQSDDLQLSNVAFFPTVPYHEAMWLIQNSDVGYAGARNIPGVYRYGISFNKIMDFMQAGLPIILPLKASHDPVSEAGCGIVTGSDQPSDIARSIMSLETATAEERAEIGQRGRACAAEVHDYGRIARNYLEAIQGADRSTR